MKKSLDACFFLGGALAGNLVGRIVRVYRDYIANPWKYTPPFETWQEELKFDYIINGSGIIICIITMIVLTILIKKREQQGV